jgi:hypothetical protein
MLAIDSSKYNRPKYDPLIGMWLIEPHDPESGSPVFADHFNYTIIIKGERLTFQYDGKSVKCSPRTLRLFGAEQTRPWISELSRMRTERKLNATIGEEDGLSEEQILAKIMGKTETV